MLVDQISTSVGKRRTLAAGRKALAGRPADYHVHVAIEVTIGTELFGRKIDNTFADQLKVRSVEPNRLAAMLIDFIDKGGSKTSLLKADVETHCAREERPEFLCAFPGHCDCLFRDVEWQLGLGILVFCDEFDKRLTGEPREGNVMPFRQPGEFDMIALG